jgi:heme/copper-type cytochrome/quinol oxidase subunit 2
MGPGAALRTRRLLLPALVLAAAAVAFAPGPAAEPPVERTLRLEARSYEYTPSRLTVNRGDVVTLELVAYDVVHGVHIEDYDVDLRADPGQTARTTFVADRAGTFSLRCSVTCGPLHPFMIGRLQVRPTDTALRAAGLALLAAAAGALTFRPRPVSAATRPMSRPS